MSRRRTSRTLALSAAIIVVALLFFASGALRPVTDVATGLLLKAAAPLFSAGAAVSRATGAASGAGERSGDSAELESLRVENAKLKALVAENEALRASFSFMERSGDDAVLARVVSRTEEDVFHGLIIDRGAEDGLAVGQPVVFGDGIIIGKIMGLKPRTASVLLLTDTSSSLAVSVENAVETAGVLEGDRGLSMVITLIPQTEAIAPGDAIITSGIEPGVRRGLVVGTVEKVNRETQDPFQSAVVAPFRIASVPTFVQVLRSATR